MYINMCVKRARAILLYTGTGIHVSAQKGGENIHLRREGRETIKGQESEGRGRGVYFKPVAVEC